MKPGGFFRVFWATLLNSVILGAIGFQILKGWPAIRSSIHGARGGTLVGASFLQAGVVFLMADALRRITRVGGAGLSFSQSLELYTSANLASRLPGGFWPFLKAAEVGRQTPLGAWPAVGAVVYSQVYLVLSGCLFLLMSGVGFQDRVLPLGYFPWGAGGVFLCLFALIHPRVLTGLLSTLLRWSPRPVNASVPLVPFRVSLLLVGHQWVGWVLSTWVFSLFVQGLAGPVEWGARVMLMSAYCASFLIGTLAVATPAGVIFPGGLGIREGVLTLFLSRILPVSLAGLVALLARVWSIGVVLLLFLIQRVWAKRTS